MVPGRLPVSFKVPRVSVVLSLILITRMGHDGHGMMNMADLRIFKWGNSSRAFCCHWCHWPVGQSLAFHNGQKPTSPTEANHGKSMQILHTFQRICTSFHKVLPKRCHQIITKFYSSKLMIETWSDSPSQFSSSPFFSAFLLSATGFPRFPRFQIFPHQGAATNDEVSREIDQVTQTADHHRDHLGDAAVILSMRRSRSTGRVVVLVFHRSIRSITHNRSMWHRIFYGIWYGYDMEYNWITSPNVVKLHK